MGLRKRHVGVAGTSVYALDQRRVIALRSELPLLAEGSPTTWVHVAWEGSWNGHPSGPFSLTRETFSQVIRNAEAQKNPIAVDYGHELEYDLDAVARGYVHRLEIRDIDGVAHLWALVEFLEDAARKVRARELVWSSAVFDFEATDRVSGEAIGCRMRSLALTPQPFIDGQTPIALSISAPSRHEKQGDSMKIKVDDLIAMLQEMDGDELSPEQVSQIAEALGLMAEAESDRGDDSAEDIPEEPVNASDLPSEDPVAMAAGDALVAAVAPIMADLGVDEAGLAAMIQERRDDVVAALQGSLEAPEAPAALSEMRRDLRDSRLLAETYQRRLDEAQRSLSEASERLRQIEDAEAASDVDRLLSDGKILDIEREDWIAIRREDRERFLRLSQALAPKVQLGEHATALPARLPEFDMADELTRTLVLSAQRIASSRRISGDARDELIRNHVTRGLALAGRQNKATGA